MPDAVSSEPVRLHAIVHGRVQGVNFRATSAQQARTLGIRGWVRNRIDGTVETIAEGARPQLLRFLDFLYKGPRSAAVTDVEVTWEDAQGEFDQFSIRL